jgi:hypothetical protein
MKFYRFSLLLMPAEIFVTWAMVIRIIARLRYSVVPRNPPPCLRPRKSFSCSTSERQVSSAVRLRHEPHPVGPARTLGSSVGSLDRCVRDFDSFRKHHNAVVCALLFNTWFVDDLVHLHQSWMMCCLFSRVTSGEIYGRDVSRKYPTFVH